MDRESAIALRSISEGADRILVDLRNVQSAIQSLQLQSLEDDGQLALVLGALGSNELRQASGRLTSVLGLLSQAAERLASKTSNDDGQTAPASDRQTSEPFSEQMSSSLRDRIDRELRTLEDD